MPTAWLPWPGNVKAAVMSPLLTGISLKSGRKTPHGHACQASEGA
jgi:hypothetical protein